MYKFLGRNDKKIKQTHLPCSLITLLPIVPLQITISIRLQLKYSYNKLAMSRSDAKHKAKLCRKFSHSMENLETIMKNLRVHDYDEHKEKTGILFLKDKSRI